VSEFGVDFQAR